MDSGTLYLTLKTLHIISFIAWMAGMLYLPRLFVYHCKAATGSELSETLKVMERRLLRAIINPAMVATFLFGGALVYYFYWPMVGAGSGWLHAKFTLLFFMVVFHHLLARWRKAFDNDANEKSESYYRIANEVPTVLMIGIVYLAVFKPF